MLFCVLFVSSFLKKIILLLLLTCACISTTFASDPLRVVSGDWQGYSEADGTGIYWDLMRALYEEDSLQLDALPYKRALRGFTHSDADIILGVYREDVEHAVLPRWHLDMEAPLLAFYNEERVELSEKWQLKNLQLAWVDGYNINRFIGEHLEHYPVNNFELGMKLLQGNRIDAFIDYDYMLPGTRPKNVASFEIAPAKRIYAAFKNSAKGKQLAKKFDLGMSKLRDSGELQRIFGEFYDRSTLATIDEKQPKIIWLVNNAKSYIGQMDYKNFSSEQQSRKLLFAQIDNYDIESHVISLDQTSALLEQDNNVCMGERLKNPERVNKYLFSQPYTFSLGLRLYYMEKHNNKVEQAVLLTDFMIEQTGKRLGLVKGRSYGKVLDQQIGDLPKNSRFTTEKALREDSMLQLLAQGKFDYFIEYPNIVSNFLSQTDDKEQLLSASLVGSTAYAVGHIMCNKTSSNQDFIGQLNHSLTKLYDNDIFKESLRKTMATQDLDLFEKYYQQVFNSF